MTNTELVIEWIYKGALSDSDKASCADHVAIYGPTKKQVDIAKE